MAHDILGERFAERGGRGPVWHGIGTSWGEDEVVTASEALVIAGGDITMSKVPAFVTLPDGTELVTGDYYIWRDDHTYNGTTDAGTLVGGPVSADYHVLQNADIAAAVDQLATQWPIETVGVLANGGKLFITLHGDKFSVAGDDHETYWVVIDSKSGKEALKIFSTSVRIVCSNTARLGELAADIKVKVGHDPDALRNVGFWSNVIPQMKETQARTREAYEALAATKATKRETALIIERTFPTPKTPATVAIMDSTPLSLSEDHNDLLKRDREQHEYFSNRTAGIQTAVYERLDVHNQEHPQSAGTLYATIQACTEVSNYRRGHENTLDESIFVGQRSDETSRAFTTGWRILTKGYDKTLGAK